MRIGRTFAVAASLLVALCFVGSYARSQDKDAAKKDMPAGGGMDQAKMMQEYMKSTQPGPHHKALEAMAGKFKYTIKYKMDPSQDWQSSEGEYSGEMALGGRYLMQNVKGAMGGGAPGEFEGMGCMGYDNAIGKFVSGWIDNMGTGVMRTEGTSADDKTITFEGEMMDPMMKKMTKYKMVYEIKSNDEFSMRWTSPSMTDGKMFESMNITYTRVK